MSSSCNPRKRPVICEEVGHFTEPAVYAPEVKGRKFPQHTQSPLDGALTRPGSGTAPGHASYFHRAAGLRVWFRGWAGNCWSPASPASPRSKGRDCEVMVSLARSPISGAGSRAFGWLEKPEKIPEDLCHWPNQLFLPGSPEAGTCWV